MTNHLSVNNGQYNIGHICTTQQCTKGNSETVAMRFITAKLERADYTFLDFELQSNSFANAIEALGLTTGDILFRTLELFIAALGALKTRVIVGTLFANFGEDVLLDRIGDARGMCIITKQSLLPKIQAIRDRLPDLLRLISIDGGNDFLKGSALLK